MNFLEIKSYIEESNWIEEVFDGDSDSLKAWNYLTSENSLDMKVLLKVHELIIIGLDPAIAGKLRKCNVTVGGRVCPPPYQVKKQLEELLKQQPYSSLLALDWHIQFEKIHPFQDGNGRTGRMIYWWHCLKSCGYPILFRSNRRKEYYALFKEAR